jgi:hypothetical protein
VRQPPGAFACNRTALASRHRCLAHFVIGGRTPIASPASDPLKILWSDLAGFGRIKVISILDPPSTPTPDARRGSHFLFLKSDRKSPKTTGIDRKSPERIGTLWPAGLNT